MGTCLEYPAVGEFFRYLGNNELHDRYIEEFPQLQAQRRVSCFRVYLI